MIKEGSVFRCIKCGKANVFHTRYSEGLNCMKCNGPLVEIGTAIVKVPNKKTQGLSIKVDVDTTELDLALEKAKLLKDITKIDKKVLIIKTKAKLRKEDIEEEEMRIEDITGMRVCILDEAYEVVGLIKD